MKGFSCSLLFETSPQMASPSQGAVQGAEIGIWNLPFVINFAVLLLGAQK